MGFANVDTRENKEKEQKEALLLSEKHNLKALEKMLEKVCKDRNKHINETAFKDILPRTMDWCYKANILEMAIENIKNKKVK